MMTPTVKARIAVTLRPNCGSLPLLGTEVYGDANAPPGRVGYRTHDDGAGAFAHLDVHGLAALSFVVPRNVGAPSTVVAATDVYAVR